MGDAKSMVYALTDAQGRVVRIEGGYTMGSIEDVTAWTLIDEGDGDRYNLCQSHYLAGPIMDERGVYRYKLAGGAVVERTAAEMDADYVPPVPEPSVGEQLTELRGAIEQAAERGDMTDEALVELAGMVDTALTCIDEQSAALVELAGIIAEIPTEGGVE